MIKVSDAAAKKFKEFAAKRENPEDVQLRIVMQRAGWCGLQWGVVLDEHKFKSDIVEECNGIKVVCAHDLYDSAKKKNIDYTDKWYFKGFNIY